MLALTGTEVERVAEAGIAGGENLQYFVVGKVLECKRHPDADQLSVCLVDVGESRAAHHRVRRAQRGGRADRGRRAAGRRHARRHPHQGSEAARACVSSGMIMSEAEIGLAAKSPGIMVLPERVGGRHAARRVLPHLRPRCWRWKSRPTGPTACRCAGMAREIAAITGGAFRRGRRASRSRGATRPVDQDISIEVRDPDLCPRYAARVIRGVKVGESPLWLKAQLAHAGMRPISNVVDVTNYVLWALGQPLHAFDLHTIAGGQIIVRRAKPGETIVTLDGEHRDLTPDMLVIADAERASVVAGIMGGLDSEITDATTDILLEARELLRPVHHAHVRRSGSALRGLHPLREGSRSRDDPAGPGHGLQDVRGAVRGRGLGGHHRRAGAAPVRRPCCTLRPERVAAVLGTDVPVAEIDAASSPGSAAR